MDEIGQVSLLQIPSLRYLNTLLNTAVHVGIKCYLNTQVFKSLPTVFKYMTFEYQFQLKIVQLGCIRKKVKDGRLLLGISTAHNMQLKLKVSNIQSF